MSGRQHMVKKIPQKRYDAFGLQCFYCAQIAGVKCFFIPRMEVDVVAAIPLSH